MMTNNNTPTIIANKIQSKPFTTPSPFPIIPPLPVEKKIITTIAFKVTSNQPEGVVPLPPDDPGL